MKTSSILLTALLSLSQSAGAALIRIGAAGGVSGNVLALAPQTDTTRVMKSGKVVYYKDKVTTDSRGRMQVLLLDQTVFTLGPDTEMILDEFVYDPANASANKVSARVTKGVFRFVTGKIARKNPSRMKVKLPVGTIGIRGTIAAGRTDGKTATIALLGPGAANNTGERAGAITVTNAGVTVEILTPGFGTDIGGPGMAPTPPFKLSNEQLASLDVAPKAEAGGGSDETGGGNTSATEESGEGAAGASGSLSETDSTGRLASNFDEVSNTASEDINSSVSSEFTQWEEMRALSGGSAFYDASDYSYACSGGSLCSSGGSGTLAFHFQIDFGARTLGGGGASSHVAFETGSLNFLDSRIPVTSFAALSGDATLVFGSDFSGTNADFNGTTFSFKNSGKEAHLNLQFTGTGVSDGILSGSSGATATGSAIATCSSGSCP